MHQTLFYCIGLYGLFRTVRVRPYPSDAQTVRVSPVTKSYKFFKKTNTYAVFLHTYALILQPKTDYSLKQKTKMNTIAILELIVGILFLSEVLSRISGGNTPRDIYYNLCRPFFLKMPMHFSIFITFIETVAGTLLAYNGILTMTHQ